MKESELFESKREWLEKELAENREVDANGCWLWTKTCFSTGYGMVSIWMPTDRRRIICRGAHRIAAWLWLDLDVDSNLLACHSCDVPRCFNPSHLFVGTYRDNTQDMIAKGRKAHLRGEATGATAKLTEALVLEIRALRASSDLSCQAIGELYGISGSHVSGICRRVFWKHVA